MSTSQIVGSWKLKSVKGTDVNSYGITLVVDDQTYTQVIPVSTSTGLTACADYGSWSLSGNSVKTTPIAGSTCGSTGSTDPVSVSGNTMTLTSDGVPMVYEKQSPDTLAASDMAGNWQMMAKAKQGTVSALNQSNVTLAFNASTYTLTGISCSETGTWAISTNKLTLTPGSGTCGNSAAYSETLSPNHQLLTQTDSTTSTVWLKKAAAPNTVPVTRGAAGVSGAVNITWQVVSGASNYNIYRGTSSGALGTKSFLASATGGSFSDGSATPGVTYYYQVTAVGANGESSPSTEVSGTATAAVSLLPNPVEGLAAIPGDQSISLSWNAVSGATSYQVYATHTSAGGVVPFHAKSLDTNPNSYSLIGWTKDPATPTATTIRLTGLINGDTYQYMVTANNANGESLSTSYVETAPRAPAALTWSTPSSGTTANLWDVSIADFIDAPVYLAVGGGTAPGTVSASDTGVILYSDDGVSWTSLTTANKALIRVGYVPYYYIDNNVGGTWVDAQVIAVGAGGTILTASRPEATTWTARASGTTNNLWGLTFSGELTTIVAVGSGGTIVTSRDGVTWAVQDSGTTENLRRVAVLGNKIIAVGWHDTILTSTNGIDWTSQTSGTGESFYGAAYNGTTFVAVGSNGTVLTTTDGASWTQESTGGTTALLDVLWDFNNGQWVAVTDAGELLTSADAKSWKSETVASGNGLWAVEQGRWGLDAKFVVSGDGGKLMIAK